MGSLFSSLYNQKEGSENDGPINQAYNVEFGYAPVGPVGSIASVPKRNLHNVTAIRRRRR
jgi:hypothetical protein